MSEHQQFSNEIWKQNYAAEGEDTRSGTWRRLAKTGASVEKPEVRKKIEQEFFEQFDNERMCPGGRVTANIGVPGREGTTLMNCFTHSPADIDMEDPDSMKGIFKLLSAQAETLKSEGGYGMNFSWLRPNGSYVKGIDSRTPGVVAIMGLWNSSSAIITRGSEKTLGGRRKGEKKKIRKGAQMGILNCWHPEIEEFIQAKTQPGVLDKFNISVGITQGFMEALKEGRDWDLEFPDTDHPKYSKVWKGNLADWKSRGYPTIVYKTVKAQELWDKIMLSTYTRNDPGVLFLDLVNELNPLQYGEEVSTTNPCFHGDERFLTEEGYQTFRNSAEIGEKEVVLTDRRISYNDDGGPESPEKWSVDLSHECRGVVAREASAAFITQQDADLVRLGFSGGQVIRCTPDHHFATTEGMVEAQHLTPDHHILMSIPEAPESSVVGKLPETPEQKEAALMGLIAGDGTFSSEGRSNQVHLDFWGEDQERIASLVEGWIEDLMEQRTEVLLNPKWQNRQMSPSYRTESGGRLRISSTWLALLLEQRYGFTKKTKNKQVPAFVLEKARTPVGQFYLAGLMYADGTVSKDKSKGVTVRLAQSEVGLLRDTQMLMHANGVATGILQRRTARTIIIKGKEYQARPDFELISIAGCFREYSRIGFLGHPDKEPVLLSLVDDVDPLRDRYRKTITVKLVSYDEMEPDTVYCIKEDVSRSIIVNTLTTRRCGEVPMSTGVCNLISVNLTKFLVKDSSGVWGFDYESFRKTVGSAVRFADNVNDISRAPLPEYKASMQEKRRVGVGVLGLGSMLMMMGVRYGSDESLEIVKNIFKAKAEAEILASAKLGQEKGSFLLFDKKKYFSTPWWKGISIDPSIKKEVEAIGCMRNSHRSANAPTGNMGIFLDMVSGGIEPVYMKEYVRWAIVPEQDRAELRKKGFKFPDALAGEWFETEHLKQEMRGTDTVLHGFFEGEEYLIDKNRGLVRSNLTMDYGWRWVKENLTEEEIKRNEDAGIYACTPELNVMEHIGPLKVIAHYTDMASSKTVNVPSDYPLEGFKNLYIDAWENGIKGITTYREGTMTAVLEAKKEVKEQKEDLQDMFLGQEGLIQDNVSLPDEFYSKGYVVRDHNKKKWYVTLAFADKGLTRPFAVFVNTNCKESSEVADETIDALLILAGESGIREDLIQDQRDKIRDQTNVVKIARAIGFLLRHNVKIVDIVDVLDELEARHHQNRWLASFPFHLKRLLKQFVKDGTEVTGERGKCPKCGGKLVYQEGCIACTDCGWSKCS